MGVLESCLQLNVLLKLTEIEVRYKSGGLIFKYTLVPKKLSGLYALWCSSKAWAHPGNISIPAGGFLLSS